MEENTTQWAAVSAAYMKDLNLVTDAALRGDDSPVPAGSVREASDRLMMLIEVLRLLDDTEEHDVAAIGAILFYIGWRAGMASQRLPMKVRPQDIQVPARHILALIQGDKNLQEVLDEAQGDF